MLTSGLAGKAEDWMHKDNNQELLLFARDNDLSSIDELAYFPKYLQVETVALCNARCVVCPVKNLEREVKFLSPKLFEKIVKEITPFSHWIKMVTIQLNGEPLLDKNLEDKIKALKDVDIKQVVFSSNASLMDKNRAESIILSGVDEVTFSIDSINSKTFHSIRRGLNFEECIGNIENFIKTRNRLKPRLRIRIRMTVQEENKHEFNDFLLFWEKRLAPGDYAYGKPLHNWANWMEEYSLPSEQDQITLNSSHCTSPWGSMAILTDGRVPLCCCDFNASILLGDINPDSIQNIWQGERFSKMRELHLSKGRNGIKICKNCTAWGSSSRITAMLAQ